MKRWLMLLLVSLAPVAVCAQTPVAEIKVDANVDFLKPPPDLHFGEVSGVAVNSKGHVFVFSRGSTTGPAYGAQRSFWSSAVTGNSSVRSARTSTHGRMRTRCGSIKTTTSGLSTKART